MVESLKERRKITKIIADIKKQCYVFQHVFKLYEALITEHYTHDKKFNCSIVLAKQIAIYASFTEQLLKILNENFVIDHKGIMGKKGLELPEEELYPNDDNDDLLTRKCQSLLMKLVSVKDYKSESGVLFAKLVDNLNFLFSQLKPSLTDLDKLANDEDKDGDMQISNIYSDFLKYINNPLKYFEEFDEEEANTSPENTLTYEKRKTQLSEVFSSISDFDIETVNIEDFGNTKYLKRISTYLKGQAVSQSIRIKNFGNERINLTTKNNPAFAENLKLFYEFLDESFTSFVNLDHTLLMLTIIPEVKSKFTSKINRNTIKEALRLVKQIPRKSRKTYSIPLEIEKLFLSLCKDKKGGLPCLTQSACRPDEFPSGELTENVTQNVSEYNSVKFVEAPKSTTSRSLRRIRDAQKQKGSVKSNTEYGFRSDTLYGFSATPKSIRSKPNKPTKKATPSARSNSEFSGFNGFNLSGEVSAGKKKKKRKTRRAKK